jgi:hypothetical protein
MDITNPASLRSAVLAEHPASADPNVSTSTSPRLKVDEVLRGKLVPNPRIGRT